MIKSSGRILIFFALLGGLMMVGLWCGSQFGASDSDSLVISLITASTAAMFWALETKNV